MRDPGRTAVGTWSAGRFMHFGEEVSEERFLSLLRPGNGIDTVVTADTYGTGEADTLLGRALNGVPREDYCAVGIVGHDFYTGERQGAKGFPRFTDPELRGPGEYASYLRMATEKSLERVGLYRFDLLMLHNPDSTGYSHPAVWEGMAALRDAGLTRLIGVAPGPANGFTLDLISCFERYGELIDWAMVILNPLEPWPGELCLPAAQANDIKVMTRVVDYGGLFWGSMGPKHEFVGRDHRAFRPDGWVDRGLDRIAQMRPIAERHGLTPLQLACQWNLAHAPVQSVVPTLLQEYGDDSKTVEEQRTELAALPAENLLTAEEVAEIREIGDNTGSMTLKGAAPDYEGPALPDRWEVSPELAELARRWEIDPGRDLAPA
ncbi:MAG: aldo/keto reductase [Solirubrobacteraceae bacterium]|nr:aldo/keto reductase [Solirubrobacteraceae bacterium]